MKRTSHAVYDTKYHLVWTPKYRKWVLRGDIREKAKRIFEEISGNHGFEIDTIEVTEDHVHIFLSFPPRYSIARVAGMLKSISASVIFKELTSRQRIRRVYHKLSEPWPFYLTETVFCIAGGTKPLPVKLPH